MNKIQHLIQNKLNSHLWKATGIGFFYYRKMFFFWTKKEGVFLWECSKCGCRCFGRNKHIPDYFNASGESYMNLNGSSSIYICKS
jgi:hypothetical protein